MRRKRQDIEDVRVRPVEFIFAHLHVAAAQVLAAEGVAQASDGFDLRKRELQLQRQRRVEIFDGIGACVRGRLRSRNAIDALIISAKKFSKVSSWWT